MQMREQQHHFIRYDPLYLWSRKDRFERSLVGDKHPANHCPQCPPPKQSPLPPAVPLSSELCLARL